ncbi:SOS response-associated peptidase [Pontivivens insulae]|uniref:Abasic site processing protein n=1 Tax=Pontivivens insulae TaxID=1639689 RepID=A0A2R8AEL6_9RHOB|nr:SOS response-associated peptidase [Pontivivens insulae]RED11901.1 putative SOS response-associated peptidase YedK [Pontivivens insulae]SPF30657.1 Putative SOS response-associated peptidase YedK [Pontivivens insulae]
MPGRVFLEKDGAALARCFGVPAAEIATGPDLAPAQMLGIVLPDRLESARWGMIPTGAVNARGRPMLEPLINIRSETLHEKTAFERIQQNRCILPCDGWYEWTGEKRKKQRWRIGAIDKRLLCFAAIYDIWDAPGGRQVLNFATLTCEPNPDVRDYHHRMPVILRDPSAWLAGDPVELTSAPAGTLQVQASDLP